MIYFWSRDLLYLFCHNHRQPVLVWDSSFRWMASREARPLWTFVWGKFLHFWRILWSGLFEWFVEIQLRDEYMDTVVFHRSAISSVQWYFSFVSVWVFSPSFFFFPHRFGSSPCPIFESTMIEIFFSKFEGNERKPRREINVRACLYPAALCFICCFSRFGNSFSIDESTGNAYLFGGVNQMGVDLDDLFRYDIGMQSKPGFCFLNI